MQLSKVLMLAMVGVMALAVVAQAGNNKFGVGDVRTVTFSDEFRIGEALLPSGEYETPTSDGRERPPDGVSQTERQAVDIRAKCSLEPLPEKAAQSQQVFGLNAANERILLLLVFRGEKTKHVF